MAAFILAPHGWRVSQGINSTMNLSGSGGTMHVRARPLRDFSKSMPKPIRCRRSRMDTTVHDSENNLDLDHGNGVGNGKRGDGRNGNNGWNNSNHNGKGGGDESHHNMNVMSAAAAVSTTAESESSSVQKPNPFETLADFVNDILDRFRSTEAVQMIQVVNGHDIPEDLIIQLTERYKGQPLYKQDILAIIRVCNTWYRSQKHVLSHVTLLSIPTGKDPVLRLLAMEPNLVRLEIRPLENAKNQHPRTKPHILAQIMGVSVGQHFKWSEAYWRRLQQSYLFDFCKADIETLNMNEVVLVIYVDEAPAMALEPGVNASMEGSVSGTLRVVHNNILGTARRLRLEWDKKVDQARSSLLLEFQDPRLGLKPEFSWTASVYNENQKPSVSGGGAARSGRGSVSGLVPSFGEVSVETVYNRGGYRFSVERGWYSNRVRLNVATQLENIMLPVPIETEETAIEELDPTNGLHRNRPRHQENDHESGRSFWAKTMNGIHDRFERISYAIRRHHRYTSEHLGTQFLIQADLAIDRRYEQNIAGHLVEAPSKSAVVSVDPEQANASDSKSEKAKTSKANNKAQEGNKSKLAAGSKGSDPKPSSSPPSDAASEESSPGTQGEFRVLGNRFNMSLVHALPIKQNYERFSRFSASSAFYLPLGQRATIAIGNTWLTSFGDEIPSWEHHFIGGQYTLRGYTYGELGSMLSSVRTSIELRRPLLDQIDGVVFSDIAFDTHGFSMFDMRTRSSFRDRRMRYLGSSVGFGFRLANFLKIDVAYNDQGIWKMHFGMLDPHF